jgi:hypothetical protein
MARRKSFIERLGLEPDELDGLVRIAILLILIAASLVMRVIDAVPA